MSETTGQITKQVTVNSDLDVIVARLRARELARELGFNTIDQARISLAAGELARVLVNNAGGKGEILISGINAQEHLGIQVMSINLSSSDAGLAPALHIEQNATEDQTFSGAFSLVDEGFVENRGEEGTRVTLMKWLS